MSDREQHYFSPQVKPKAGMVFSTQGPAPVHESFSDAVLERGIFMVADGFGGANAGDEAARQALTSVKGFLQREAGDVDATLPFEIRPYFTLAGNVLLNAVVFAHHKILNFNKGKNLNSCGGCSLTAGFIESDLMAIVNIGSTSVTLFRDQKQIELVIPRTLARMNDPLQGSSALVSGACTVPLISLGTSLRVEPEVFEYKIKAGDWFVFHSDGFSNFVKRELHRLFCEDLSADEASERVVALLKQHAADYKGAVTAAFF